MNPLPPEDERHLNEARGWIELGNGLEADAALDNITARLRAHPEVLLVRWFAYELLQKWDVCLDIAEALIRLAPERGSSWTCKVSALTNLGRVQEAYDVLLTQVEHIGRRLGMIFDLARLSCRLGRLAESKQWLEMLFETHGPEVSREMVLDEPDLEPLWKHLGEL